jgi:hypothetical protein
VIDDGQATRQTMGQSARCSNASAAPSPASNVGPTAPQSWRHRQSLTWWDLYSISALGQSLTILRCVQPRGSHGTLHDDRTLLLVGMFGPFLRVFVPSTNTKPIPARRKLRTRREALYLIKSRYHGITSKASSLIWFKPLRQ